ncbi:GNAT family N-acetyltransferase [Thalassolituus sp. LLYu03]|uniref:GNAT family N-acetyltransferase n=1 Tax=Thalassolituus sp. LLYu03 TaxID=3421656 RepID=UPI003D298FCB
MEIEVTNWNAQRDALKAIRQRVFIEEQGVPEALEWDSDDADAVHFLARDGKRPVGCARLLANGTLGRMAVVPEYRRHKIGTLLIRAIENHYQREFHGRILKANVQTRAFAFYRDNGFTPEASFNIDAGIPHVLMNKVLGRSSQDSEILVPGRDSARYVFEPASGAAESLLQIGCQSAPRTLEIAIHDLALPIWSDTSTLSCINRYLREARQRSVRLLIANEYAGIADHRLIQLQQRMSSRIQLKVHGGIRDNLILMTPYCWIEAQRHQVVASLNDRPRVARLLEQYHDLWRTAQTCKEAQRLKI